MSNFWGAYQFGRVLELVNVLRHQARKMCLGYIKTIELITSLFIGGLLVTKILGLLVAVQLRACSSYHGYLLIRDNPR